MLHRAEQLILLLLLQRLEVDTVLPGDVHHAVVRGEQHHGPAAIEPLQPGAEALGLRVERLQHADPFRRVHTVPVACLVQLVHVQIHQQRGLHPLTDLTLPWPVPGDPVLSQPEPRIHAVSAQEASSGEHRLGQLGVLELRTGDGHHLCPCLLGAAEQGRMGLPDPGSTSSSQPPSMLTTRSSSGE